MREDREHPPKNPTFCKIVLECHIWNYRAKYWLDQLKLNVLSNPYTVDVNNSLSIGPFITFTDLAAVSFHQ